MKQNPLFSLLNIDFLDYLLSFKPKFSGLTTDISKRNVLVITPLIVMGGAEKLNLTIAQEVSKEKFIFHILTTDPTENSWRSKFEPYFHNIITPMDKTAKKPYFKPIDQRRLNYFLKKLDVKIVLLNGYSGYKYVLGLKSANSNIKIVDIVHNELNPGSELLAESVAFVDKRICISNKSRNYVAKMYKALGFNKKFTERLEVIYNGIDLEEFNIDMQSKSNFKQRFNIPKEAKIISFVGRISEEKNPILFVDIAKEILARSNSEIRFVIAGDGPYMQKVRDHIAELELSKYFVLTGPLDNVALLLNDSFVLLVVSKREGMPLSVLEAMYMGIPVISVDVGAINEVIQDNFNSLLIDPKIDNIIETFATKVQYLLTKPADYTSLSNKARATIISRFDAKNMGALYQKTFEELAQNN